MSTTILPEAPKRNRTVEDLVRDLGDIPLSRIRLNPPIGTATVADVERNKNCELVEGTLVEKAMGYNESLVAAIFIRFLGQFVSEQNLGLISAPDGPFEIDPDLVRYPDVGFASWDRFPNRRRPSKPIPEVTPDLAVEVLSAGNTKREMERKRREYFAAGTRLVWIVDPVARTVAVYTSETDVRVLTESDTLDGGDVLPGFRVELRTIFAELDRVG